jgi:uncharacterized protein
MNAPTEQDMKILVAGRTRFLGTPLVSQLRAGSNDVSVLTRGRAAPGRINWSPNGTIGSWATAIDGADVVINLAGESIADHRWTETHKARIRYSRISPRGALWPQSIPPRESRRRW